MDELLDDAPVRMKWADDRLEIMSPISRHHELIAFLKQPDLALHGKRQLQPDLIVPVVLGECVRRFRASDCRRIFFS